MILTNGTEFSGHFGWNGKRGIHLSISIFSGNAPVEWPEPFRFLLSNGKRPRPSAASLTSQGQVTNHTTIKWAILDQIFIWILSLPYQFSSCNITIHPSNFHPSIRLFRCLFIYLFTYLFSNIGKEETLSEESDKSKGTFQETFLFTSFRQ